MSTFRELTNKVNNSPAIIGVFLVFTALLGISIVLIWEDFTTSLFGYQQVPTKKVNEYLPYLVAALPQLVQIGLAYLAIERKNPYYLLVAFVFFLIDVGTDVYYKSYGGQSNWLVMIAFLESMSLYTLGSEILFVFSAGE